MKRLAICSAIVFAMALAAPTFGDQPPSSGPHYNLNIIGFSNCTMDPDTPGVYPDCFKGSPPPGGHVIFVPLKTAQVEDICKSPDPTIPSEVTVAQLQKGVRILVTDGEDIEVLDKDATDGTARFSLPDGCWQVFASPGGKPGGCLDLDTILCFDLVDDVPVQVNCDKDLINDQFVLVGHINVDRITGKPKWENVTSDLLTSAGVGTGDPGFFDFFWQIYNQNLKVLHLRFISCD